MQLCEELYWYQVVRGRHFHLEQPLGSVAVDQAEMSGVREGTLKAIFDMCMVGQLQVPGSQTRIRKSTAVYTTSRALRDVLDARRCDGSHDHVPISGSWRSPVTGKWEPLSTWTERYTTRFAKQLMRYFVKSRASGELPLLLEEHVADCVTVRERQQQVVLAVEIAKRRRLMTKTPAAEVPRDVVGERAAVRRCPGPRPDGTVDQEALRELFVRLDGRTPRVGVTAIEKGTPLFREVQQLCPGMVVEHVEACRGTERFRVPQPHVDRTPLLLRQMYILHRVSGQVECMGPPERWQRLSKVRQVRKAGPARLGLTVFGSAPALSGSLPAMPVDDDEPMAESTLGPHLVR